MAARPRSIIQKFKANPFAYAGLPLLALVVGGSLFLSTFTQTHVEIKDKVIVTFLPFMRIKLTH
ncbi:hypothetical protein EON65_27220 [archaeon]|nr:MAG: hypothetical protein EON65_27220 [archaeon]